MSVNFQLDGCRQIINTSLFCLCDDDNATKAYADFRSPEKWIVKVENENRKDVSVIAVDKCVIKDHEHPGRGRCDLMLTTDDLIVFVELKDQARKWKKDAIEQLESTIKFFIEGNDISLFKHKKAFACNKQHKPFQVIEHDLKKRFFNNYRVRIDIQSEKISV